MYLADLSARRFLRKSTGAVRIRYRNRSSSGGGGGGSEAAEGDDNKIEGSGLQFSPGDAVILKGRRMLERSNAWLVAACIEI